VGTALIKTVPPPPNPEASGRVEWNRSATGASGFFLTEFECPGNISRYQSHNVIKSEH